MSQDNVTLGIDFTRQTETGITSIGDRMQKLDKEILSVNQHLDGTLERLNKLGKASPKTDSIKLIEAGKSDPNKRRKELLAELRVEQQAARRYLETEAKKFLPVNATKDQRQVLKTTIDSLVNGLSTSTLKVLDKITDVGKKQIREIEAENARVTRKREAAAKKSEAEYYTRRRNQENKQLSTLLNDPNRKTTLGGLREGQLQALLAQNKVLVNQAQKQGSYGAAQDYRILGNAIGKTINKKLNPEAETRRKTLQNFRNPQQLSEFITWAKASELKSYRDEARSSSTKYSKSNDVENAEKMARISNRLDLALKALDPKISRLYSTATKLKADPSAIRDFQNKSIAELSELQSSMLKESKKRFQNGDSGTGQILSNTANSLQNVLVDKKSPFLADNQVQLSNLLRGKIGLDGFGNAGLESLKKDATAQYRDLSKQNRFDPLAESLRKLAIKIDQQIKQNDRIARGQVTKSSNPTSELARYEEAKTQEASRTRFTDGMATNGVMSGLASSSVESQKEIIAMSKRAVLAQKVRVTRAEENKESQKTINLERKSLRLAEKRLREIKETVTEARKEADVAAKRKTLDVDELRYNARKDVAKSQMRREVDGGAEQFRNQGQLLRNYALMGAGVGGIYAVGQFTADLDKSMKQLQSILALTNNEMVELEENIIRTSEKTKFTAIEVTEAAVTLGQSGLSKEQISDTLEGITLFATAIGTDLKTAVDLATSTLGVYKIESSRMTEVVDKLTTSVNNSKLNLDKLTLGIQYAGNIASQSNVSFEETVATLGAMANSGIRSGSTLGTGLRQILITLQNPSEKFREKISSLNLTMEDLDLRTHGLVKVMTTLARGGFTVTDAMQVMEVRAAAAFGAFSNNLDVAESLSRQMEQGGAATEANAVQMGAFSNQLARFGSIAKSVFYDALKPYLSFLTDALRLGGDFLQNLRGSGNALSFILATLTGIAALKVGGSVLKLMGTLATGGVGGLLGRGAAAAGGGAAGLSLGRAALGFAGGPVVGGLSVAAAIGSSVYANYNQAKQLNDPLDQATAAVNRNEASLERYNAWLKTLQGSISNLYLKQVEFQDGKAGADQLKSYIRKLNNELKDMGFYLDENSSSFDDVTTKLAALQKGISEFKTDGITSGGQLAAAQLEAQSRVLGLEVDSQNDRQKKRIANMQLQRSSGYAPNGSVSVVAQRLDPRLSTFDPTGITRELSELKAESGVTGKTQELQAKAREYYNFISGLGNLPADRVLEAYNERGEDGKRLYRSTKTDPQEQVKEFRDYVQKLVEEFKPVLDTASKQVELAIQFEKTQGRIPQSEQEVESLITRLYQPVINQMQSDLSVRRRDITLENKNDPVARYEAAKNLTKETKFSLLGDPSDKLSTGLLGEIRDTVEAELRELLKENYTADSLNNVLGELSVIPTSQGLISAASDYEKSTLSGAEGAYFQRSEGRIAELTSRSEVLTYESRQADTEVKIEAIKAEQIKIADELADIDRQRNLFKVTTDDSETRAQLEQSARQAKIQRDVKIEQDAEQRLAKVNVLNSLEARNSGRALAQSEQSKLRTQKGFLLAGMSDLDPNSPQAQSVMARIDLINETLQAFDELLKNNKLGIVSPTAVKNLTSGLAAGSSSDELRFNARYQDPQSKGFKQFYDDFYKEQARVLKDAQSQLENQKNLAESLEAQSAAKLTISNDGQLGSDTRQQALASARKLGNTATTTENSAIQAMIDSYRNANNQLMANIKSIQQDIKNTGASGVVKETLEKQVTKFRDAISENNIKVEKLSGDQQNNSDKLVKQNQTLDINNKALDRLGYVFKTAENERMSARLRGGQYTSDSGVTEDFSDNGSGFDSFAETVFQDVAKSYEGFDAITEAGKGIIEIGQGIADAGANAFSSWVTGAATAEEAFKGFAMSLLDQLQQLAMKILSNQIMTMLITTFAGGSLGGVSAGSEGGALLTNTPGPAQLSYNGGLVTRGYAAGGEIVSGIASRDSTLIKAAKGEFVLRSEAVKAIGVDNVRSLNALDRSSAKGMGASLSSMGEGLLDSGEKKDGGTTETNIWLVDDRSQVKSLGPQDIISIISDDAARNGQTKKLIQTISRGNQ